MRFLSAFLFFFLALASAKVVEESHESVKATPQQLQIQKDIYQLLYHVHQPNIHKHQVRLGEEYSIEAKIDNYSNATTVKHFLKMYKQGILPKGHTFSVLYSRIAEETEYLFKLFYYAKTYETFYHTACWAREHVNEHMFAYALSVAVLHRPDMEGIILPAPYEILPTYFFPTEVIDQAYKVKMQEHGRDISKNITTEDDSVIIKSEYSGWYVHVNTEQKLSYFTEDIGLNSFYYYSNLDYPTWMNGEEFDIQKDGRGERFYFLHKQLLARYYMERLTNGLGEIPEFSWRWPVETGFYPSLKHYNGMEYPSRPNHFDLRKEEFLHHLMQVEDYERRLRDAIDEGHLVKPDGSQISLRDPNSIDYLGNVIQSNADSPNLRYYRYPLTTAKMLLGNSPKPMTWHHISPSALEHYQTCMRDPIWYQLHKRYYRLFAQYQEWLYPYTTDELLVPGVTVEDVQVEKLITYFNYFDSEITNVVHQTKEEAEKMEDNLAIKVRQSRLNHKPFTVTIKVDAEKPTTVVAKIFIGPKYDSLGNVIPIMENRHNFVKMDEFLYELKAGKSVLERNSNDFYHKIKDFTPSHKQYQQVLDALDGKGEFLLDQTEIHSGFPQRLLLPKGRRGGMPFQLYVVISKYEPPKVPYGTGFNEKISYGVGSGARRLHGYPLGYPFDRPIWSETAFYTPNMKFLDVVIYHQKDVELNTSHP